MSSSTGLVHIHSGKVRDLYRVPDGRLVMVASDRISAFDHILGPDIPDKGRILTAMSVWWFQQLADVVPNHLGADPFAAVTDPVIPRQWSGRAVVCESLQMLPVEAVARGYLTGSGLLDYRATGSVCGVPLPAGLVDGDRLPEPIFTPATKAELGEHDENVSFAAVESTVGADSAARLRELTLLIYARATALAAERGIILADTKFEFGRRDASPDGDAVDGDAVDGDAVDGDAVDGDAVDGDAVDGDAVDGDLVLGDEVLTPDSSRFWPADRWQPGRAQPSFDKQYVRDWLLSPASGWNRDGSAAPPALPHDVVLATRARYVEAYERLTGLRFADWPGSA